MAGSLRRLQPDDAAALEVFLVAHRDSSMFLRSNARRHGLERQVFAGAFRDGRLVGVAAHGAHDTLLVQSPEDAGDLARACVAWSGRRVAGIAGPEAQVRPVRTALGLDAAKVRLEGNEWLYALDLPDLRAPTIAASPAPECRAPAPHERDTLCTWRLAYDIETLGATDSPEARRRAAGFLDQQIADGNAWVAVRDGQPVSLAAFNAALPDIVQLGGIYTPPALRGKGFARVAVGAALAAARDRGATRAVLFTNNPSAVRTYESLGFRRTGDYALILFH